MTSFRYLRMCQVLLLFCWRFSRYSPKKTSDAAYGYHGRQLTQYVSKKSKKIVFTFVFIARTLHSCPPALPSSLFLSSLYCYQGGFIYFPSQVTFIWAFCPYFKAHSRSIFILSTYHFSTVEHFELCFVHGRSHTNKVQH